jgi:glycosyltransferase involved in cell wall biosynthesis
MNAAHKIADVLLILPVLNPSGAERVVAELAKRLPALGFPTSVLCLEDETAAIGVELKNAGIPVSGLRLTRRQSFACGGAIARHIRSMELTGPLIICSQLFHANIAARIAAMRLPETVRKRVHILAAIQVTERRFRPWQFWFDRLTAKYACYEICVAKSVAHFQREKTGLPAAFFKVIENGNDLSRYAALNASPSRRAAGEFRVVSVGRLNKQKDYPTLLRAWKHVEQSMPGARLGIAGNGPEESRLKTLAAELNLKRVSFAGFCSDVPAFLNHADLYVQSSAWEGLPLSVFEAMAAGLPVIASAVDSLPDMIEDGVNGVLFECGNDKELAAKIVDLLDDRARSKSIGHAAREMALKRFSADRMTAEYAALFKQVLSEHPE